MIFGQRSGVAQTRRSHRCRCYLPENCEKTFHARKLAIKLLPQIAPVGTRPKIICVSSE
jgi:hypothetical protein